MSLFGGSLDSTIEQLEGFAVLCSTLTEYSRRHID